tara:strand:+ start:384 stop:521 length:138 start_codon:yes stop_codon:yes gene_type:complete
MARGALWTFQLFENFELFELFKLYNFNELFKGLRFQNFLIFKKKF